LRETGATTIRLVGLSHADAAELEDLLEDHAVDAGDVHVEEEELPSNRLGEPVTFILLASITMAALGVLGAFLMKKRTREDVRYSVTVRSSDGTTTSQLLEFTRSTAQAPDAEVIEKLAAITRVPVGEVGAALRAAM
jgi:hypothetical protein